MINVVNGKNNTYKAVRIVGETYNLLYTVWCTNEHELYDMVVRTVHSLAKGGKAVLTKA